MTYTYTAADRRRLVDSQYRRHYKRAKYLGIDTAPVPIGPTRAHVRTLYDLGWSYEAISRMSGLSDSAVQLITTDTQSTVHRATAEAILALPASLAVPDRVPDTCLVPSLGSVRRIRALQRLGWTHADMKARGVSTPNLTRDAYHQTVAAKWRQVAALYDELSMSVGGSGKTIARATAAGHAPPLAWTDIDDPYEVPHGTRPIRKRRPAGDLDPVIVQRLLGLEPVDSTRAEKEEAMRQWLAMGRSERSLCKAHGWKEGRHTPRKDDAA